MYVRDYYGNVPVVVGGVGPNLVVGSRLGVPRTWTSVVVVLLFKPWL